MAASKAKYKTTLQIVVEKDTEGNTTTVSLSKVNPSATDDQFLTAAKAIGSLQTRTISGYRLVETSNLSE